MSRRTIIGWTSALWVVLLPVWLFVGWFYAERRIEVTDADLGGAGPDRWDYLDWGLVLRAAGALALTVGVGLALVGLALLSKRPSADHAPK